MSKTLMELLKRRFGDVDVVPDGFESLTVMAGRGSVRAFKDQAVDPDILRTLAAVALSSPTKSDLQQRDIVLVTDSIIRGQLNDACGTQNWLSHAPCLIVFLGNHRRQRKIHARQNRPFVNDHLDALINATADAAIALSAFVTAAESIGLGCCPVSAIRNNPEGVAEALKLPDLVFPLAALAVGWPADPAPLSPRLPLRVTLHENTFDDQHEDEAALRYDQERHFDAQRMVDDYGTSSEYGWSEDKARQYSRPERADFGAWIKKIGFNCD